MYKLILLLMLMSLLLLIPVNDVNASENITLITNVVSDNVTITLITNVINDHSYAYWWGCCGDGWGDRNGVPRSTPLWWLEVFPNMITGIASPSTAVCGDIRAEILRLEPSSVTVGIPVDIVFVVESSCNYAGNVSLLLDGQTNQSLGVDLSKLRNRTYRTTIATAGLSPGKHNVLILGSTTFFNVVGNVVSTSIEVPQSIVQSVVEKTQDNLIIWVAIAIGGIILVTVVLLIILR